ncbi:MAG: HD domain-containing protein [Desulfobacterales bacterium]|nr:HD domain-containing protein [Desulfobacterales bacterium]MCP4159706.1 HD domain-containing protein [Deltaproteobacteria bacterium]
MTDLRLLTVLFITFGAVVMTISIFKYRSTIKKAESLISINNNNIYRLYYIHLILMLFFLFGYIVVLLSLIFDIIIIGAVSTGIIFFFGAIFVFIGILLQSDMLSSIKLRHKKLISKNKQLLQTENVTIFALAYQAEIRDYQTGKHLERTSMYVKIIAEELRMNHGYSSYLTDEYISDIVKSAPLHDIGKVGIPDSILQKPGKLTSDEFEIIKKHCEYGADILKMADEKLDFDSFFKVALKLVTSHHERWDGKGYPKGLKEDEIPLSARIMALADVYDALRSDRCYKEAFTHELSCSIIKSESGKQFDPDIVDVFIKADKKFLKISENSTS